MNSDKLEITSKEEFDELYRFRNPKTKIGKGCCYVYLGYNKSNEYVAIKRIKYKDKEEHLLNEIEMMRNVIGLPGFIQIYNYYINKEDRIAYIIMEYFKGSELFDFVISSKKYKNIPFIPENKALNIFNKILLYLDKLHKKGFIHHDLKLENILYNPVTGKLKIIDFEFMRHKTTKLNSIYGSPSYISPEIRKGLFEICSEKTDIFSLGVCLWIMLCGYYPFNPYQLEDVEIKNILNESPKFIFGRDKILSDKCKFLLFGMLEKNPDKRLNLSQIKTILIT